MNVDRYKYYYEGYCNNFISPMSINMGRTTRTQVAYTSLMKTLLSSLSLLVKIIEEEIQLSDDCVDKTQGWTLKKCQVLLQ